MSLIVFLWDKDFMKKFSTFFHKLYPLFGQNWAWEKMYSRIFLNKRVGLDFNKIGYLAMKIRSLDYIFQILLNNHLAILVVIVCTSFIQVNHKGIYYSIHTDTVLKITLPKYMKVFLSCLQDNSPVETSR